MSLGIRAGDPVQRATRVVDLLGGHLAQALAIDLDEAGDDDLRRWLIATCLHAPRADEERVAAAFRALDGDAGGSASLAARDALGIESALLAARHPRPDVTALLLIRVLEGLDRLPEGSLCALLDGSDGLEALGSALSRLAPGFGRAAIARFLRPLRERWPVCAELPLDEAARAAAIHLELLEPDSDPEFAAERLRRRVAGDGPPLRDLEAALLRLGRRACVRERVSACPLEDDCPLA